MSQQDTVTSSQKQLPDRGSDAGTGIDVSGRPASSSEQYQHQQQAESGAVDLAPDTFGSRQQAVFNTESPLQPHRPEAASVVSPPQPSFLEEPAAVPAETVATSGGGFMAAMRSASGFGLNRPSSSGGAANDTGAYLSSASSWLSYGAGCPKGDGIAVGVTACASVLASSQAECVHPRTHEKTYAMMICLGCLAPHQVAGLHCANRNAPCVHNSRGWVLHGRLQGSCRRPAKCLQQACEAR